MVRISTFVFFDLETTGLPFQERNRTKIIELSFVAVARNDMMRNSDTIPPTGKLSLLLNPEKPILSAAITGITNDTVKYAPTFKEKFNTISTFLEDLSKPVCLVAHNGNIFDYKILRAECADAGERLPEDLLCGDSLLYFKAIFNKKPKISRPMKVLQQPTEVIVTDEDITDDEDEWPELNVTPEELQEIDDLSSSLSELSCESEENSSVLKQNKKQKINKVGIEHLKAPNSYKLTDIFKTLLGREPENAHRAEGDCLMMLQCAKVCQNSFDLLPDDFLSWMDNNCKRLNEIKPLIRK